MEHKEEISALEAILFASGEPVHIDILSGALQLSAAETVQLLQKLADRYAFDRCGIRLLQMDHRWQLCSAPEYGELIRSTFEIRKTAKLSPPALEVLAIIAYHQPVTRAYIDQVRGVDSAYTVGLLLERELIEECGRLQVAGRPRLYRTTENFLRSFHITSLEELPPLSENDEQQTRLEEIMP